MTRKYGRKSSKSSNGLIEARSGDEEVVMVETATMVNDEESQGSKNSYLYVIRAVSGR